ncbi:MAG TPA: tyrosine-type recombinase/integrase, partial [Anaerolineales bacterium]|nr:tyrosine-type recombinase/integrase [Anaerolineales bacterium]
MLSQAEKTQQTFLQQECYLPILAETFITAKRAEGLSKGTLKYYREKINIFLAWCEAQAVTQVQDVTADLLRRFMLTMSEGHNAGGVHGIYRGVRAFLRFIEAEEVLPEWRSPTKRVKAPKVELEPIEGASLDDISTLLATCTRSEYTGARDNALFMCLLDTGARVTEFLSIDQTDVDSVGAIMLKHTKAKRPRYVYLSQKARRALRAYLRMRRDNSPALWMTKQGERLTYDGLRAILTRRAKLADLNDVPSPHDFRRAMALTFLRNGGDIFSLARLLGHKDINILK